jgi:hypothetical protein
MKKKRKKQVKQKRNLIPFVIVFVFVSLTLLTIIFSVGYSFGKVKSDYDNSIELYWLRDRLISCYEDVRDFVPHCLSPVDCMHNSTLTGCFQDNCNWCCYNSCTMMKCIYYSPRINVPENMTLLIPEQ